MPKLTVFLKCVFAQKSARTNHLTEQKQITEEKTHKKYRLIKSIKNLFACTQPPDNPERNIPKPTDNHLSLSQFQANFNTCETPINNHGKISPQGSINTNFTCSDTGSEIDLKESEKTPELEVLQTYETTLKEIKSGILPRHLYAMTVAAEITKCIFSLRPVSTHAKYWTKIGHPTKSMLIKDKSEKQGIAAGLVKIAKDKKKEITDPQTGQKFVAIGKIYYFDIDRVVEVLNATALYQVNPSSIVYLDQDNNKINAIDRAKTIIYRLDNNKKSNNVSNNYYQILKKTNNGWALYEIVTANSITLDHNDFLAIDQKNKFPVRFWCYEKEIDGIKKHSLPVTADYDLLTTFFSTDGYSPEDLTRPINTSDLKVLNAIKLNPFWYQIEVARKGNANKATLELIRKINQSIKTVSPENHDEKNNLKTYRTRTEVHHNGEATNPASSKKVNENSLFPALFLFPKTLVQSISSYQTNALTELEKNLNFDNISIKHNTWICNNFKELDNLLIRLAKHAPNYQCEIHAHWLEYLPKWKELQTKYQTKNQTIENL